MTIQLTCPGCGGERKGRTYVCADCWWLLKPWVRTALRRRDNMARARLMQLRRQLNARIPMEDVEVSP